MCVYVRVGVLFVRMNECEVFDSLVRKHNFLIHVSIIYVMSRVRLAIHLSVLCGKNVNVGHCTQTSGPDLVIPAVFIGTIGFFHFMPLLLTLTLSGGHKVRAKANLLASFSCTLFI